MAHQDYIARSTKKNNKNKKNPYKPRGKKAVNKSSMSPLTVAIIVAALLGGSAYGLYFITTNPGAAPKSEIKLDTKTKPAIKVEDDIPAPPVEQWDYVEGLKHKEVPVDAYEVEQKGPYIMQCASFKGQKDAQALKAKIAFSGFIAQIRKSQGKNGLWYKVVLGPFERKRDAEKTRHKLKNNNINGCQIWLWT